MRDAQLLSCLEVNHGLSRACEQRHVGASLAECQWRCSPETAAGTGDNGHPVSRTDATAVRELPARCAETITSTAWPCSPNPRCYSPASF